MLNSNHINVLSQIKNSGINLWVEKGTLKFKAEKGALNDILKNKIVQHRSQIIEWLTHQDDYLQNILIPVSELDKDIPATQEQYLIWHSAQLSDLGYTYNIPYAFIIEGELDVDKLKKSIEKLVAEEKILSMNFHEKDGKLYQSAIKNLILPFDFGTLKDNEDSIRQHANEMARTIFDLEVGPCFHVDVKKLRLDKYLVCMIFHHIIVDAASIQLIFEKISQNYDANPKNDKVAPKYTDYVYWQNRAPVDPEQVKTLAQKYLNLPEKSVLPADKRTVNDLSNDGNNFQFIIPESLSCAVKLFSKNNSVSINVLLLAVFIVLLRKYSRFNLQSVGMPTTTRDTKQKQLLIGPMLNTAAIMVNADLSMSFTDIIKRVSEEFSDAITNSSKVSFDQLVLHLKENNNRTIQLFNTMFMVQPFSEEKIVLKDFVCNEVSISPAFSKFDLTMSIRDKDRFLAGNIEYKTGLFTEIAIENISNQYLYLLESLLSNPVLSIEGVEIVKPCKTNTVSEYNFNKSVCHQILENVELTPNVIALYDENKKYTYSELWLKATTLADEIRKATSKNFVGLMMDRSTDAVISLLAILLAEKVFLPIDTDNPVDRINYIVNDSDLDLIIVDAKNSQLSVNKVNLLVMEGVKNTNFANYEYKTPQNDDLAYIIYTSGSTGQPKGVSVNHNNFSHYIEWTKKSYIKKYNIKQSLVHSSFAFDLTITSIFGPLASGGTVYVPMGDGAEALLEFVKSNQDLGLIKLTPSHLRLLQNSFDSGKLSSKTGLIIVGGEALYAKDIQPLLEASPDLVFINEYGPTETTVGCAEYIIDQSNVYNLQPNDPIPIGCSIDRMKMLVLDEAGHICPPYVPGEIVITGTGVTAGYLNRADLNKERFISELNVNGCLYNKAYRSGDLAITDYEGQLIYCGRIDEQVKVNGYRIELGEIETILTSIDSIKQAVVLPLNSQLIAFIVFSNEEENHIENTRQQLQACLPYYMQPKHFVAMDKIPLTINGKADKTKLLNHFSVLSNNKIRKSGSYDISVLTHEERIIYKIWEGIFDNSGLDIDDSFFELGGDSIKVLEIASKLKQSGFNVKPKDIYKYYSIKTLAQYLKQLDTDQVSKSVTRNQVSGNQEGLPIVHWFFELPHDNFNYYNQSFLYTIAGNFKKVILEQSVRAVINNHPALRLRANFENAKLFYADTESTFLVSEIEVEDDRESVYSTLQQSLNIEHGPILILAILVDKIKGTQELLIIAHHLVMDLVSWFILVDDLEEAYVAISDGNKPKLVAEETTFKDWSAKIANYSLSDRLNDQLDYWLKISNKSAPQLFKHDGMSENANFAKITHSLKYSVLDKFSKNIAINFDSLLLGILGYAMNSIIDRDEVVISLEHHGRHLIDDSIDLSRTIGWFTSQYPFSLSLSNKLDNNYLRGSESKLREIPDNGLGFGILKYLVDSPLAIKKCAPVICFNFLGKINLNKKARLLTQTNGSTGSSIDPTLSREFALEINCYIFDDQLNFEIHFNRALISNTMISNFCGAITEAQKILICDMQSNLKVDKRFGLGPLQNGLLYHAVTQSSENEYVTQLCWDVKGPVDIGKLQQAWCEVVKNVEVLRTIFNIDNVVPEQIILNNYIPEISINDLTLFTEEIIKDGIIENTLYQEREKGFDLLKSPPSRLAILKVESEKIVLVWTHHHILIDGWSASNVKAMLEKAYHAPKSLKTISYQPYINYLSKLNKYDLKKYWETALQNVTQRVMPKLNMGNKSEQGELGLFIDAVISNEITEFSKLNSVTPSAIFQSAWSILLAHYKGHSDVVFGITFSHRPYEIEGIADSIGLHINTLPFRIDLKNKTILELIQYSQQQSMDIVEHGAVSISEIGKYTKNDNPGNLIHELFIFENYPTSNINYSELKLENLRSVERTSAGLALVVAPGDNYEIKFSFDRNNYSLESIKRIHEQLIHIIMQMLRGSGNNKIEDLSLLPENQANTLITDWNNTDFSFTDELSCMHEYLDRSSKLYANQNAVVADDGILNYTQLSILTNRYASVLNNKGLLLGDRCVVHLDRSKYLIAILYAILKCGGVIVPVDINYPLTRKQHIFDDCQPKLIITNSKIENCQYTNILLSEINQAATEITEATVLPQVSPLDTAYIIYTSGSTGKPKGVLIDHAGATNMIENIKLDFNINPNSRLLMFSSISFDSSIAEWAPSIAAGATIYVPSRNSLLSPDYLLAYINEHAITTVTLPPALLTLLPEDKFSTITTLITAGEACPITQVKKWANNRNFINAYGPSEAVVCSSLAILNADDTIVTIGSPIRNKKVYLLDEKLNPVAIGAPGELYISGKGIAQGYLNQTELTESRFLPDPFNPEFNMYKSGDVARWLENGNLEYIGRTDNQIQLRGYRVELSEITQVLETHVDVNQAFVTTRGEDELLKLVAFVLFNPDSNINESLLKSFLRSELADYMVPQHIIFVDKFPLTQNGKIDGSKLDMSVSIEKAVVTVAVSIAEMVMQIFTNLLDQPVQLDDDFFALGGHSLLAVRLVNELENRLQHRLALNLIFELRTANNISEFISVIKSAQTKTASDEVDDDSEEIIL